MRLPTLLSAALFTILALFANIPAGRAAEDFAALLERANGAYKQAEDFARKDVPDAAAFALDEAIAAWGELANAYPDPPAPYAGDRQWRKMLKNISARLHKALALVDRDDPDNRAAYETLRPIRILLHESRQRAGIVTLADRILALSAVMEVLWPERRNLPDAAGKTERNRFRDMVGALNRAFADIRKHAPAAVAADPSYRRLMAKAEKSMPLLIRSVESGNKVLFLNILRELRSVERLLYFNFG